MILIFPDIHGRSFWKKPLQDVIDRKINPDNIVFLGDYFDPYLHEGISVDEAIINWHELTVKVWNSLSPTIPIFLYGNHDYHYLDNYFGKNANGGRISHKHLNEIRGILKDNEDMLQIAYQTTIGGKNVLFTHAGVNANWYNRHKDLIGSLTAKNLNNLANSEEGLEALSDIGICRWGNQETGSPLWNDVNELQDESVADVDFQICGHSQQKENPVIKEHFAMLDCRKPFILNDKCEIEPYPIR